MRKLTMLGNRVLLAPMKQSEMTAGGIALPQSYQDDEKRYQVVAVGPGRKLKGGTWVRIECKPGDIVLVAPYQAHTILDEPDGQLRIFDASAVELVETSNYPVDTGVKVG